MDFKTAERKASILLAAGEIQRLEIFLGSLSAKNKTLVILENLIDIFKEEVMNNVPITIFDYSLDLYELVRHYVRAKLLLRRFDFDLPEECLEEFYYYSKGTDISGCFLAYLLKKNMFYPEKVYARVQELFSKKEGVNA